MAGDFDFMCINNDKSLAPIIMPGDVIALKKLATWKTYIPGDLSTKSSATTAASEPARPNATSPDPAHEKPNRGMLIYTTMI